MKYALINGERQEAQPGLSGKCPSCDSSVIAKCGTVKMWHWAHKGKLTCDPWWENEIPWHRAWKGQFPKEWQEFIQYDEKGEKHIADVKTDQEWVIEFQHSFIKPEERQSRESFYKKMIWIVDGSRRLRDKTGFIDAWENHSSFLDRDRVAVRRLLGYYKCPLLRDWVGGNVPVFFDFGEDNLWGLISKIIKNRVYEYAFIIKRNELISYLLQAAKISFEVLLKSLNDFIIKKEELRSLSFELQLTKQPLRQRRHQRRSKRL